MTHKLMLNQGDLIIKRDKESWNAIKVLAVDPWPDGTACAHCLTFKPLASKPTAEWLRHAAVLIYHMPMDARCFNVGWERVGNEAPTKDELIGFVEYLKQTDFSRYVDLTGQNSDDIIHKANEHFANASSLCEQQKRVEAIAEYSMAIDLVPVFYEAIDNRAFIYMELGRIRDALDDFELSLRVNPNGMSAFFSKGECLLKLGDLPAAEAIFQEGQKRFPEKRELFDAFLDRVRGQRRFPEMKAVVGRIFERARTLIMGG